MHSPTNDGLKTNSATETEKKSKRLFGNTIPLAGGSGAVAVGEGSSLLNLASNGNTALPARSARPSRREDEVGFKTVSKDQPSSGNVPPKSASLQSRLAGLSPAQQDLLRKKLARRNRVPDPPSDDAIAIVGMGCRFPGAPDVDAYWQLIQSAREAVDTIPSSRWDADRFYDPTGRSPGKMSVNRIGSVDGVDQFDPAFFGIAPREASRMDPQQRLLLEVAWETFENAGIPIDSMAGSDTGVFIGIGGTDYSKVPTQYPNYHEIIDAHIGTGHALSIAAARISYLFDFKGPSFIVDTACSSALVAIHNAIVSLRSGESNAAVAGGVNLILSPETTIAFSKARMLSPDGHCRPFDEEASGYVRGEGCGLVLLKRLADAKASDDQILGIIRGSAINQDGRTSGITAPSSGSQIRVIQTALKAAGLTVDDIDYIEAHGTGTPLGDPIELTALGEVFAGRRAKLPPVRIGSVKANIGHTETASGIAGLLKVLHMFQQNEIPKQANFDQLNRNIHVDPTKLQIAKQGESWDAVSTTRRVGVSSFGFGGTNAHLVIESPPPPISSDTNSPERTDAPEFPAEIPIPLSATDSAALVQLANRYANLVDQQGLPRVADIAHAAATQRSGLALRCVSLSGESSTLRRDLGSLDETPGTEQTSDNLIFGRKPAGRRPRIAMLFTGQGSQYVSMAKRLKESLPEFGKSIQACGEILSSELPVSLDRALMGDFGDGSDWTIDHTLIAQPAICAVQCALVDSFRRVGIRPDVIAGHSIGEIAAFYAAELISLEDALRLSAIRGRVMGAQPSGGTMAAIFAGPDQVQSQLRLSGSSAVIATINGPLATVVAGLEDEVDAMVDWANSRDIVARRLSVSHAFHSPLMQPACEPMREALMDFWKPFKIPTAVTFLSSVTGERFTGTVDVDYWIKHLVSPVRFADVIEELDHQKIDLAIEIGPSPHVSGMIKRTALAQDRPTSYAIAKTLDPKADDHAGWIRSVSRAWCIGAPVNWKAIWEQFSYRPRLVALPNYPFQRSRYWLESEAVGTNSVSGSTVHPLLGSRQKLADGTTLFCGVLSANNPSYLLDHVVSDSVTVPAAAWVEALRAAAASHFDDRFELRDLEITRALFLDETQPAETQPAEIQTRVSAGNQRCRIEIAYRVGGKEAVWQSCASATAIVVNPKTAIDTGTKSTSDENGRLVRRDELYSQLSDRRLTYGEFFKTIDQIKVGQSTASANLKLSEQLHSNAHQYGLHPTLLDGCFHLFATFDPNEQRTFLPVGIRRITFADAAPHSMPTRTVVKIQDAKRSNDHFFADVELIDEDNVLIARLSDVKMQSLEQSQGRDDADPSRWVHHVQWTPMVETSLPANADDFKHGFAIWKLSDAVDATTPLERQPHDACGSLLRWIQSTINDQKQSSLAVVVEGGNRILASDHVNPVATAVLGMCRVAANENPGLNFRVLDSEFDSDLPDHLINRWLGNHHTESEMALRGGRFYQGRMIVSPMGVARQGGDLSLPASGKYRVRLDGTNRTDGLWAQRLVLPPIKEDEVSISIRSVGLNDSDVMKSMGNHPGLRDDVTPIGIEVCGVVTGGVVTGNVVTGNVVTGIGRQSNGASSRFKIGDRVMGVVPHGFASDDATKEHLIAKVPPQLSNQEAASIPIAFLTAHYALMKVGRLNRGESVLIHAAAGGVGLAAIQVAHAVGAVVYATAGTPIKRQLLVELGVASENLFDSRDVGSIELIREVTGGRGVDVVLNPLPGDWIEASLRLLAPLGRFLEIGKTDIHQNRRIGLESFQDNLTYSAIDLERVLRDRPDQVRELFDEVVGRFEKGVYRPTALTSFGLDELPSAMRFMAEKKNVGKIVVGPPVQKDDVAAVDGIHMITGGSGSVAMGLARRLIQRGAAHVALVARRPLPDAVKSLQDWTTKQGASCQYLQADCTSESSMRDIIANELKHPIVSVFHTAGVLDDGLLHQMTSDSLDKVLEPKVDGAIVMDKVTADHPVRAFVMTGSVASVFGSPGQANYAAANAFLEGFASDRRHRNLPASVIHLGPLASNPDHQQGGMADDQTRMKNMESRGIRLMDFGQSIDLLIDAMEQGSTTNKTADSAGNWSIAVDADFGGMLAAIGADDVPSLLKSMKADSPNVASASTAVKDSVFLESLAAMASDDKREAIAGYLAGQLGLILSMDPESIDLAEPLAAFGLDSLMAIELKSTIEVKLGVTLPISKFMNEPTLYSLADAAVELVGKAG